MQKTFCIDEGLLVFLAFIFFEKVLGGEYLYFVCFYSVDAKTENFSSLNLNALSIVLLIK